MRQPPGQPHGHEPAGAHDGAADSGGATSPLPAIDEHAATFHHVMQRLLELTIEAQRWGGVPAAAGLTVRDYLELEAGLPSWLAGQVVALTPPPASGPACLRAQAQGSATSPTWIAGPPKGPRTTGGRVRTPVPKRTQASADPGAEAAPRISATGSHGQHLTEVRGDRVP